MRVFLFFLFFLSSNLFAASFVHPDFGSCYQKSKQLFTYHENFVAYPYEKNLAIVYAPNKNLKDFIKYDRFLGLYLVKSSTVKTLKFKKTDSITLGEWLGSADDSSLFVGNFAKKMDGLESNAKMASLNEQNGVIMCLCCEAYGISSGNGEFIESEYIKNFVEKKDDSYGSLGVRFAKMGDKVYVLAIDPFCKNRVLELNDEIVQFDGKDIKNLPSFQQDILFSTPLQKHIIKVKRDSKLVTLNAITSIRHGGGLISDTFLERFGLFFDDSLNLIEAKSFGLKIKDKLLQINGIAVKSQKDIQEILSKVDAKKVRLLFTRSNFEFFVEIKND